MKALEKNQETWTVDEVRDLVRAVVLHGETLAFNKCRSVKRSIASKKAKWFVVKKQMRDDLAFL